MSTKIEWTEETWNPLTGCTKISLGCKNCYAERMAGRLKAMKSPNYSNGFNLSLHPHVLEQPLTWKKPRTVFVNSMSDLFHEKVPFDFISDVFSIMNRAPQHTFQVLTKRSTRLSEIASRLNWGNNIWMGVTVESNEYEYRIRNLVSTDAAIKFVSFEPLLSSVSPNLNGIDWVIVGGESGPGARPMLKDWVRSLRDQCKTQNTSYFFKQWGGTNKKKAGRELDGRTWDEYPLSPQPLFA